MAWSTPGRGAPSEDSCILRADLSRELYGAETGDAAGLPSGTVHPILARLEGVGWLESRWEDVDPCVRCGKEPTKPGGGPIFGWGPCV